MGCITMITSEIRSLFTEIGLDCTEMVEKFMDNEEMFLKYFKKFFSAADGVVKELTEAVEAEDLGAIENRAHALKGLSGNVGINGIYNPAKKMVDDIREGNYSTYKTEFRKLSRYYALAVDIAAKLD